MAKKKSVNKKRVVKKAATRKISKKTSKKKSAVSKKTSQRKKIPLEYKIKITLKNIAIFLILFIVSFALKLVATKEIYINLFALLSMLFGFLVLTFIIIYLIFLILRIMSK